MRRLEETSARLELRRQAQAREQAPRRNKGVEGRRCHAPSTRRPTTIGKHLDWHEGLTPDYLFDGNQPSYIEVQPAHRRAGECGRERSQPA
jgi:hypothetical protein